MNRSKVRIRFRKAGDLRFLSHHDLMRLFERMMRRAAVPFRSSEGFHPMPKMSFASALGLGIVGVQEVVDIELEGEPDPWDIRQRLATQAPAGLEILSVRSIDPRVTAQVRRVTYRLPFDPGTVPDLPERIDHLMAQEHCCVERLKPQRRKIDIRPFILGLNLDHTGLTLEFRVTPQGAARPDEVVQLLGLGDLLITGAVLERTVLELEDEIDSSVVRGPLPVAATCDASDQRGEPHPRTMTMDLRKEPYEERDAD